MKRPTSPAVWVSGASSGIGRAMFDHVLGQASVVTNVSRRAVDGARNLCVDLADPSTWESFATDVRDALGGLHVASAVFVHAAAGGDPLGPAREVDTRGYVANAILNAAAPLALGQMFLTAVPEQMRVVILLISSGAGRRPVEGLSSYGAGKAAVDHWARTVAAEEERRGRPAKILAVAPGIVDTPSVRSAATVDVDLLPIADLYRDLIAGGGLADPHDVAGRLWALIERDDIASGAVLDLRDDP